ncbi:MAG TPA: choice-of-anchor J domain-containing protein [Ignavibacteria bacterium]|nr:choice-of-anchor J domain-containing protein [Ignavibacteria bacterium]
MKLNESFEGNDFPPAGWSLINTGSEVGEWKSSVRNSKSGSKCAVSNFTAGRSVNTLVTKSFIPAAGDSLMFYFRQTFWNNYKDTFNILISSSDSLFSIDSHRLYQFIDSISYPVPVSYGKKSVSLSGYAGQKVWIGFQHINSDGENIRLDAVSAGQPGYSEVSVMSNLYPAGVLSLCTFENIIPKAVIKNSGTIDQTIPFNIIYSVTGPVNYLSIKSDILNSGFEKTILFDTIHSLVPGIYNVRIYTSLEGDVYPLNDTLLTSFSVVNTNFGGGQPVSGNYYFVNSSSCTMSAPSHPVFCWKDTAGSKSLILNGQDNSGGLLTGDIDNGYFRLGSILPQGKRIKFFNGEYDSVFISTNGVIGFRKNNALLSSDPGQIGYLMSQPVPAFSPLWMDLDFGNSNVNDCRLSYKIAGNQLIITYDKAPQRSGGSSDYVSFQVIIEFGESMPQNSRLIVQYDQYATGENFIMKYNNNTLPSHLIGMKNAYGNNYLLYRSKDTSGVIINGPIFNSSLALEIGPDPLKLNNKCSELEVILRLEAIYPLRDSIKIILRDSESPYEMLESRLLYPDTNGIVKDFFTIPSDVHKYYIHVEHRNSIETWSRENGEQFSSFDLSYDFTSDITMAYGNNMIMKNGKANIYCGDVNKDGIVDGDDLISVFNTANLFSTGYLTEDIDNNSSVDLDDLVFLFNNNSNFISKSTP